MANPARRVEGAAHDELVPRAEAEKAVTAVGNRPAPGVATAGRRGRGRLRGVTGTPRTLRRLLIGLVLLSLVWGAVAAWVVSQRSSGANNVVSASEPLSLDRQQIYRALSDADATEATAFLAGGLEPLPQPPGREDRGVRHRHGARRREGDIRQPQQG